jgi:hypothetical protein
MFLFRLFGIAALLAAVISLLTWIRRPIARHSIRRELPEGVTDQEVELKVKTSQRSFSLKLWLFVFGLPMILIVAMMVANNMSIRIN